MRSLGSAATLPAALSRLGFVQADPIRAPARAQDLILRHRVAGYRAGDLERAYPELDVEEDLLYAYGFLSRAAWRLLHPRRVRALSLLERRLVERVRGPTHPGELEAHFGRKRVVNAWGGSSKETTAALERLHYRGLLRVARRDNGIRVYAPAAPVEAVAPAERLAEMVLLVADLLAPVASTTLHGIATRLKNRLPGSPDHRGVIKRLLKDGRLEAEDGYVWPAGAAAEEPAREVRFLAPFDPIVWDRRRFEDLWGWAYRFEAYTPVKKRVRGYYAMPLLFGDQVIGWANATGGDVEVGFVGKRPRGEFGRELEAEVARLRAFLNGT